MYSSECEQEGSIVELTLSFDQEVPELLGYDIDMMSLILEAMRSTNIYHQRFHRPYTFLAEAEEVNLAMKPRRAANGTNGSLEQHTDY